MRIKRKDKYFIVLFLIAPMCIFAQEKVCITDTILCKEIKIQLPPNYKKERWCYGEGCFFTYYYQDSATISVFSGGMQRLPLLHKDSGYYLCYTDTIGNKISSYGIKDNNYWREDSYKDIRIYYDRVKKENKSLFDEILNKFIFKYISD